MYELWTTLK